MSYHDLIADASIVSFHEGNGNTNDSSANGRTLTANGSITYTDGLYGKQAFVTSDTAWLSNSAIVDQLENRSTITLCGWMRAVDSNPLWLGSSVNSSTDRVCLIENVSSPSGVTYYTIVKDGDVWPFSTNSGSRTGYHHHALTFDGSRTAATRIRGYYDGTLQTLDPGGGNTPPDTTPVTSAGSGWIGEKSDIWGSAKSAGNFCNVGAWTRELSGTEISELYAGPEPTNTVAPVASFSGGVLSCTAGTWDGYSNGTVTYAYQWQSYSGSWSNVSGATSSTYTPTLALDYRCAVTATNDGGSHLPANSNAVTVSLAAASVAATLRPFGSDATAARIWPSSIASTLRPFSADATAAVALLPYRGPHVRIVPGRNVVTIQPGRNHVTIGTE